MNPVRFPARLRTGTLAALLCCALAPAGAGWLEAVRPAVTAPELALTDVDGGSHRLDALSGKVVLVNFWATWCTPCLEEMPSIARLRAAIEDSRLRVLGVVVEEPAGRVRRWTQRLGLDFPSLLDREGRARKGWGVRVFPSSYLVDGGGRIRYRALGPVDWDSAEAVEAVRGLLREIGSGPPATVSR